MAESSTNNLSPMSDERVRQVSENNAQRRELKKNAQETIGAISESPQGRKSVLDLIGKGGALGRRVEREIRRYESTGRISNWLTNSATNGDLKNIAARTLKNSSAPITSTRTTGRSIDLAPVPLFEFPENRLELPSGGGGGGGIAKPWDIYIKETLGGGGEDGPTGYILKVRPATASNILPSNWDEQWSVGKGLVYGIVTLTTDGRNITGASIDLVGSNPSQQAPQKFGVQSQVEYLFGLFKDGLSYNVLQESIYLYPRLRLVTSANPPAAAGQSPFDLWYELGR